MSSQPSAVVRSSLEFGVSDPEPDLYSSELRERRARESARNLSSAALDISTEYTTSSKNVNRGPGTQWLPLLGSIAALERRGTLLLGSPRQPFDPRELVWTCALAKGGEAVVKVLTTLESPAAYKRFSSSSSLVRVPEFATSQTHLDINPRAIYQELAVLMHAAENNEQNIIKLLGIDRNYSFNYFSIVLELAEDRSLKEYLATTRIGPIKAKRFCSEIMSALSYVHSLEILHNDLKTENVLIARDNTSGGREVAKLADFGHAVFNFKMTTKAKLRRENRLIGTLRWTAPELYDPSIVEEDSLSVTSDIYSFGFVVALLAGGADLFSRIGTDQLNRWKYNDEILLKLPRNIIQESAWSSAVLKRTLRLNPSTRFQSIDEMLLTLGSVARYARL